MLDAAPPPPADDGLAAKGARAVLLSRVGARLPPLQAAETRVAQVLLDEPADLAFRSVAELATLASTSTATVVRCVQKLGFGGVHDLRSALTRYLADAPADEPGADGGDPRVAALRRVTVSGAASVRDASALVDPAAFAATVDALDQAGRVLVLGIGGSAPLGQYAAQRLTAVGHLAEAPADPHVQHLRARLMAGDDVCLALSHSGATRETVASVRAAVSAGATTVAITSFAGSPLNRIAHHAMTAGGRRLSADLEPLATRLAHMVLIESLVEAVSRRQTAA